MKKETNKWKSGFWVYFAISTILILYLFAKNNNNEVTLAFTKLEKSQTELDLKIISKIINNTDLTKSKILNEIKSNKLYKIVKTENNIIELEGVILIFEKEKLVKSEIKKVK